MKWKVIKREVDLVLSSKTSQFLCRAKFGDSSPNTETFPKKRLCNANTSLACGASNEDG